MEKVCRENESGFGFKNTRIHSCSCSLPSSLDVSSRAGDGGFLRAPGRPVRGQGGKGAGCSVDRLASAAEPIKGELYQTQPSPSDKPSRELR